MNGSKRNGRAGLLASGLCAALLAAQPLPAAQKQARAAPGAGLTARIDHFIDRRLREEKVPASPPADDAEFLRRVCLDLTGVVPSAERAAAFLDSTDPDKRRKLVDELLAGPKYGRHLADFWAGLLLTRTSDSGRVQAAPFVKWLRDGFNADRPWDRTVRELVSAGGTQDRNPAVTYFLVNGTVDRMTDNVTRNFLGVQLQCAQCHNHPFAAWKQDDYWGMAAFFLKVRSGNVGKVIKGGGSPGIIESASVKRGKGNALPVAAKLVPARFLQGGQPRLRPSEPYRPVLADWLTSPKNPYFAKATVNRVWAQLFGRGLVNPVDDLREENAASHPELLDELAAGFAAGGFDLKGLYRAVCNTRAYQRTSRPAPGNEDAGADLFGRAAIKVMTPEQLYDSLAEVTGAAPVVKDGAARKPGKKGPGVGPREAFVAFFRTGDGADPTEYQAGIPQALRLMNSKQFDTGRLAAALAKSGRGPEEAVERLYLAALARRPRPAEKERLLDHVRKVGASQAYGDVLWALLNSSEFALNH